MSNKWLEYIKSKYMSYSNLKLLSLSQKDWWNQYVNKQYPDSDAIYFVLGKAVHAVIESYNLTWDWNLEPQYAFMRSKINDDAIFAEACNHFDSCVDNYKNNNYPRADKAEYKLLVDYLYKGENYKLMWIVDAREWDTWIDYKTVAQFTDLKNDWKDNAKRYEIQWWFYMLLEELNWTPIDKVIFREVKKSISSLAKCRKTTLLEMAWLPLSLDKDRKLTKDWIIAEYNLKPVWVNDITIKKTPELMERIRKIVEYSIDVITDLKEDTLQSPLFELFAE